MLAAAGAQIPKPRPRFAHGARFRIGEDLLFATYHPSQQNTFTGKLTQRMLRDVLRRAVKAACRAVLRCRRRRTLGLARELIAKRCASSRRIARAGRRAPAAHFLNSVSNAARASSGVAPTPRLPVRSKVFAGA